MATRKELEAEWIEYQKWTRSQSLEWEDYLEHRDLKIAKDNLETLKELIDTMEDEDVIKVWQLKEILKHA